jgi:hypothetical protein
MDMFRKEFQGHHAAQFCILGRIDYAYCSDAEFLNDAVVLDGLANHWRESYVCEPASQ